jgi:hypothetical protein
MSQRKYNFEKMTDEQLTALAARFPKAVETITIRKPVYSVIAKLLDCGVEVPEVKLAAAAPAGEDPEKPAFLGGKKKVDA